MVDTHAPHPKSPSPLICEDPENLVPRATPGSSRPGHRRSLLFVARGMVASVRMPPRVPVAADDGAYDRWMTYPVWAYFPRQQSAAAWVDEFLSAVAARQDEVDSRKHVKMDSDQVVKHLEELLTVDGWQIEASKKDADKIHRPVLFGDNGTVRVKQELDGWHPVERIILEVESGRGWQGNAVYRDLVRASLVAEAEYLALGVRQ
jgi:hypothetical protein